MNSDRDGIRGGWATPGDDQPDAESGIEMTGEFTIDYAPPAWYTQNAAGAADTPGTPPASEDGSAQPGPPAPPVGAAVPVPNLPPAWTAQPAPAVPPSPPVSPVAAAAEEAGQGGDLVGGATMRISSVALKRQIAEAGGSVEGEAEAEAGGSAPAAGTEAGGEASGGSETSGVPGAADPAGESETGE